MERYIKTFTGFRKINSINKFYIAEEDGSLFIFINDSQEIPDKVMKVPEFIGSLSKIMELDNNKSIFFLSWLIDQMESLDFFLKRVIDLDQIFKEREKQCEHDFYVYYNVLNKGHA